MIFPVYFPSPSPFSPQPGLSLSLSPFRCHSFAAPVSLLKTGSRTHFCLFPAETADCGATTFEVLFHLRVHFALFCSSRFRLLLSLSAEASVASSTKLLDCLCLEMICLSFSFSEMLPFTLLTGSSFQSLSTPIWSSRAEPHEPEQASHA
jgi:hypothetical protein